MGDIRTQGGAYATEASAALGEGASKLGGASAQASSTVGAASADVLTLKAKVDAAIEAMQDVIDRNTETIAELQDIVDAASARLAEATGDDTVLDPESPLSGITDETGQIAQDAIDDAQAIIDQLTAENAKYQDVVDRLTRASDNLGAVATSTDASVEQIDAAVQNAIAVLGGAQTTFNTDLLPQLSSGLDSLSSAGSNMTAAAAGADTTIDQAVASSTPWTASWTRPKPRFPPGRTTSSASRTAWTASPPTSGPYTTPTRWRPWPGFWVWTCRRLHRSSRRP